MDAILALEDGTVFRGEAAGADGEARGEVVFNTSMTGYQEVLTDPSYAGQIVTMTCPEIGNYGVSPEDVEPILRMLRVGDHEPANAEQWRGLGQEFAYKMLAGIVGLEFTVTAWQCKLKLNQHRREAHHRMHAGYAAGNEHERELARWMERLGLVQEEQG